AALRVGGRGKAARPPRAARPGGSGKGTGGGTMTRRNFGAGFWLVLVAAGSLVLALGAADARAVVVGAAPAWPVPVGVSAGPPPVPALPVASGVPPAADQIADPV